MYHVGLVIGLTSTTGQHAELLLEKNAVVELRSPTVTPPSTEVMHIPAPAPPVTLRAFLDAARRAMGDEDFFLYDAFYQNCQDFVCGLLRANGALSAAADAFVKQDLTALVSAAQPTRAGVVVKAFTDLAARVDRLVHGG